MPNVFRTQEQREHWREYNREYLKKNYKTVTIFFNKTSEKQLLDYLESQGPQKSVVIKKLIREKLEG